MKSSISVKQEKALETFRSGLNCAQSVLMAFQKESGKDLNQVMALSAGFGSGMGRLQLTCGALTGAFMAIGQYCSKKYSGYDIIKDHSYTMIQDVHRKFIALHNVSDCRSLLEVDLNQVSGRKKMNDDKLNESVCEKCVLTAVAILEEEFADDAIAID
jgi:C_GCAxxG_C_C family probable redox protein